MHRKLFLGIIAVMVLISPAAALAGGDIYVGGPYGTKITSLPYVINAPGSYYLGGNLSYAGDSNGITINANNVTLDLMGFTLAYTGSGTTNDGVFMWGQKNVEVRNGTVRGWCIGVVDTGFANDSEGHRVINIRAMDSSGTGVMLFGQNHLIQGCTASSSLPGASGFVIYYGAGIISGCVVKNFGTFGISVGTGNITDNVVAGNGAAGSIGIDSYLCLVMGNEVSNCGDKGIFVTGAASIIGNTVATSSSEQIGIKISNETINSSLMDQNTVTGPGTHYNWGSVPVQWRNNAGYP